jgi:SPP1 gp7 family putative phage head morphogenesis protein
LGKPQAEPLTIEAEFARAVLAEFERIESAAKAAFRAASNPSSDASHIDLPDLRAAFDVAPETITDLVSKLDDHNARQIKRSLGLTAPEMTQKRLKAIAKRTLRRVRGIATEVSERLTVTVAKAAREGLRSTALQDAISRSLKVGREDARKIAVGQVIQINAELTRERHQRLGVTEYVWRSVSDRHTRLWHRNLNGTRCRYDSPPLGGGGGPKDFGHPGTADRCRCQPLPVIPPAKKQ